MDYDANWPNLFAGLRDRIWPCLSDLAISIEHIGSTSAPGLSAKPVIDIDVVIASREELPGAVARLATLGYVHRGDLGIEDREAFSAPAGGPAHHLYVCPRESVALRNHLALRDHLRTHPGVRNVAVVAMPDPMMGEKSCAFVVPGENPPTLSELRRFLVECGLADYKLPDRLELVDSLPMTSIGKLDRRALRAGVASKLAETTLRP